MIGGCVRRHIRKDHARQREKIANYKPMREASDETNPVDLLISGF